MSVQSKQRFFAVKDFERLQYRADKVLPWIKLYTALLDDPAFEKLPDAAKFQYIGLLLLARKLERFDNTIPWDADYIARKLSLSEPLDLDFLMQEGFILPVKRQRKAKKEKDESNAQSADSERPRGRTQDALDREGEEEGDKSNRGVPFAVAKNATAHGNGSEPADDFSDAELNRYFDLSEYSGQKIRSRPALRSWLRENMTPDLAVRIEERLGRDAVQHNVNEDGP